MDRRREDVVRRLAHVDVVVGCAPAGSFPMTSLAFMFDDVPEPVWKTSIGNCLSWFLRRPRRPPWRSPSPSLRVEHAELAVGERGGALDAAEPAHDLDRDGLAGDREVLRRPCWSRRRRAWPSGSCSSLAAGTGRLRAGGGAGRRRRGSHATRRRGRRRPSGTPSPARRAAVRRAAGRAPPRRRRPGGTVLVGPQQQRRQREPRVEVEQLAARRRRPAAASVAHERARLALPATSANA